MKKPETLTEHITYLREESWNLLAPEYLARAVAATIEASSAFATLAVATEGGIRAADLLIEAWAESHPGVMVPWAKAVQITGIVERLDPDQIAALLALDDKPDIPGT